MDPVGSTTELRSPEYLVSRYRPFFFGGHYVHKAQFMYEFMCTIKEVCHSEQLATQESVMDHPEDFIRARILLNLEISEPEYLHLLGSFMHQISHVCFVSVKYHLQV